MNSPWSNVPFVYCRFSLCHAHTVTEKSSSPTGMRIHSVNCTISAVFRLQNESGVSPSFSNPCVSFRVVGRTQGLETDTDLEIGLRMTFDGHATPGKVTLSFENGDPDKATLQTVFSNEHLFPVDVHRWMSTPGFHREGDEQMPGCFILRLQQPFPPEPGPVAFQPKPTALSQNISPFCMRFSCDAPIVLGNLRLTPDLPTFRIVDDTVEQRPFPHCRVRVRCPDGAEREFVTDEAGELFLSRADDDVYTLLEILDDGAPLSLARPGAWSVEPLQDVS
ncbi:MAG: hypothetical protein EOO71_17715 [Myxococcaceae bacterium]|nr:MAG: hypothetical protein EOO71_17715 [Myxococcaceae bacterium]